MKSSWTLLHVVLHPPINICLIRVMGQGQQDRDIFGQATFNFPHLLHIGNAHSTWLSTIQVMEEGFVLLKSLPHRRREGRKDTVVFLWCIMESSPHSWLCWVFMAAWWRGHSLTSAPWMKTQQAEDNYTSHYFNTRQGQSCGLDSALHRLEACISNHSALLLSQAQASC